MTIVNGEIMQSNRPLRPSVSVVVIRADEGHPPLRHPRPSFGGLKTALPARTAAVVMQLSECRPCFAKRAIVGDTGLTSFVQKLIVGPRGSIRSS
jgi:hypothetical protein